MPGMILRGVSADWVDIPWGLMSEEKVKKAEALAK
jgi:hypothetical protein